MLRIRQENMKYTTVLYLLHHNREIRGICEVEFSDGVKLMPVRVALLHLPFWEMWRKLDLEVSSDKIFFEGPPFNSKVYKKIMKAFYEHCFEINTTRAYIDRMTMAMWDCITNVSDLGTQELPEYLVGLSIIDLAEIHMSPEVQDIIKKYANFENCSPLEVQKKLKLAEVELMDLLESRSFLPGNALHAFAAVGALKPAQIVQVFIAYGVKTEINDFVYKYFVKGNAINGLTNVLDYIFENCSARKNVYYSHDAIKTSQYFNREISLVTSSIQHLYPGACGSSTALPFRFTPELVNHCIGKFFYLPGKPDDILVLTDHNCAEYTDREVYMFSPITCAHTDGVCERCVGLLARNHTPEINVGMTASTNFVSSVSQLILSIKHLDSANPVIYVLPEEATEWFTISEAGIRLQPSKSKQLDTIELGLYFSDLSMSQGDLEQISMDVPEHKFSEIKSIVVRDVKNHIQNEYNLVQEDMIPFLTKEFIIYIKDHLKAVTNDEDIFYVPLIDMQRKTTPILRSLVYNNSMMTYVTHLTEIFRKRHLSQYSDASKALTDISRFIIDKVKSVDVFQIEILLKAHEITSSWNYSIPVVTNPYNVLFGKTKEILANRTISCQLPHEGHKAHFASALTYVTRKDQGVFDAFMGV